MSSDLRAELEQRAEECRARALYHAEQARIWGRRARWARGGVWFCAGAHLCILVMRVYEQAAWWTIGGSAFNVAALSACLYFIYWAQRRSERKP